MNALQHLFIQSDVSQTFASDCCHVLHAESYIEAMVSLLFSKCQMVVLPLNKVTATTDLHFHFGFEVLILNENRHNCNCSPSTG